jgi:uncharacterized protein
MGEEDPAGLPVDHGGDNGSPERRKGQSMKTLEEIRRVIRAHEGELRKRYKTRVVGIFGSYVRGQQQRESDLDLLAEFDEKASLLDLGGAQVMLSELLEVKVDLVPREDIRPELKDTIEAEVLAL